MVTSKTLIVLVAAATVAAGGAYVLLQGQSGSSGDGMATDLPDRLFPGLEDRLNDVTALTVTHEGDTLALARTGDGDAARWTIADKDGYPADLEAVREVLIRTARLAPVEAKTSKPELFDRLGLQPIDAEGSSARLVELAVGDETVASVLVGEAGQSLSSTRKTVYVRKPDENQTWMAEGELQPATDGLEWLDRTITNVRKERIREVLIHQPDGSVLTIERPDPDDSQFSLRELPEGRELDSPSEINQVSFGLEYLDLDDVTALPAGATGRLAMQYTTYGGLQVDVRLVEHDGRTWTAYEARQVDPATEAVERKLAEYKEADESEEKDPAATATGVDRIKDAAGIEAEVAEINGRTRGWLYAVPDYKIQRFSKTLAGMLKPPTAPEQTPLPATGTN